MKTQNKFYHFGDSFAFNNFNLEGPSGIAKIQPGGFGWRIANHFGLDYQFEARTGDSNELIFKRILEVNDFKKGDTIFINWSFFTRSWYLETEPSGYSYLQSTNHWFDDDHGEYTNNDIDFKNFIESNGKFMDYLVDNSYEITTKLFRGFVAPFLETLVKRGVKVYHLFIRYNEQLSYRGKTVNEELHNLPGHRINFNSNYFKWLEDRDWKNEQQGHYSKDIQGQLATIIIEDIEKNIEDIEQNKPKLRELL